MEDIKERHEKGQPILVGTTDVAKSEELSIMLDEAGVPHNVLNAKQHAHEAQVVFEAGRKGMVTVATNMAGRGTDIMLGGNPEHIADQKLRSQGLDPEETPDEWRKAWSDALSQAEAEVADEHEEVVELGGLYVLGTERHDARRIDNQLRGRSGRQGDPGESRFYLAMDDPLMKKNMAAFVTRFMNSSMYPEDLPLESKLVSGRIQSAQHQTEAQNFEIRKNVLKYDDVMTDQRDLIYRERQEVLQKEIDLDELVPSYMRSLIKEAVSQATAEGADSTEWDLEKLWNNLRALYPVRASLSDLKDEDGNFLHITASELEEMLQNDIADAYEEILDQVNENPIAIDQLGDQPMAELERRVLLATVDRLWQQHLYEMDYLKEGIGLRAMGQRDPLVEYKSEGALMFENMMGQVREDTITGIFNFSHQFQQVYEQQLEAEKQQEEQVKKKALAEGSVMGDTGHKESSKALPANAGESEQGAAFGGDAARQVAANGGNRAQRRAQKKAKKRR